MNRLLLRALFIILLSLAAVPAICQQFPMLHYTVEDGLPSNMVYQVYRDNKGFLWFGTDKGVARYNGIKFEVFTTFNGLPDNEIFFFREDQYGRLWLGTLNGELCYYKDDTFHTAANTPFLRLPFKSSHLRSVTPQKDSSINVVYDNPSVFLNIHHGRCQVIDITKLVNNEGYGRVIFREKITSNRYRVTLANTALIVDTNAEIKQRFNIDTFDVTEGDRVGNFRSYTSCQNQDYLYNTRYIYTPDMHVVKKMPADFHKHNFVNLFFITPRDTFYTTSNGLYINDTLHLLKDMNVSSVTSDKQGNFWITTLSYGVHVLRRDFYSTKLFKNAYEGKVRFSYAQKGHLFYTNTVNNLYTLEHDQVSCLFNYANFKQRKYNIPLEPGYYIDSNYTYYNFYNHDFIVMDNVFSRKIKAKYCPVFDGFKSLLLVKDQMYVKRKGEILRFWNLKDDRENSLKSNLIAGSARDERIFGFAKDQDNNVWYSTVGGLYKVSDSISVLQSQFKKTSFKYFEFLGKRLIGYTHDNQLLICTNVDSKIIVDSVLNENCIWDKFYKLDDLHMLISTNNYYRLLTIDGLNNSRNFKVSIIQNPFVPLQAESICMDNANCYFFANGQVTSVDVKSQLEEPQPPELFFTILRSGTQSCTIHDEVIIPFAESRNMSVSFATLAIGGNKVTYQYSVSKNDKDNWIEVNGEEISLINSGYGSYTIKIRAKTLSSDYCKPVEFTLRIMRPFWATWWFITFVICMTTAIFVIISRQRLSRALSKKDKEHELQVRFMKSEYKALNALMNPHFIFNTLNNVQGLINRNDKLAANEYLRVIADLIRQNMHNISKELIPLQKEIDLITNYLLLEKLRFKEKLNYSIIIEKGLDLTDIMVPPLLIQPLIENSIKHGILPLQSSEGAIYMNIYERKGILYIEVRDNGVGLAQAKQKANTSHESFGLENIRKRIEQLSIIQNKEITFNFSERKNTQGKLQWTIVTISMPITD